MESQGSPYGRPERRREVPLVDLKARRTTRAPRRFRLVRHEDETGISGTGTVAWGVVFPDGVAVTRWNSEVAQTCVWQSMAEVEAVHGHGGKTEVEWIDLTYEQWLASDPFLDAENIDPEHEHLEKLVDFLDSDESVGFGAVCSVYELCSHPLCEASYNAWAEFDRAREAINRLDQKPDS